MKITQRLFKNGDENYRLATIKVTGRVINKIKSRFCSLNFTKCIARNKVNCNLSVDIIWKFKF